MSTLTLKIASLYAAYSPELGVVSYGACQDEALNNLAAELAEQQNKTNPLPNAQTSGSGAASGTHTIY